MLTIRRRRLVFLIVVTRFYEKKNLRILTMHFLITVVGLIEGSVHATKHSLRTTSSDHYVQIEFPFFHCGNLFNKCEDVYCVVQFQYFIVKSCKICCHLSVYLYKHYPLEYKRF